jgi:uncharacterized membrane protein
MNWRSPLAIAGGLLLTWSIIEWLYFGLIRPDVGDCLSRQIQSGDTCYETWYYSLVGILIGLGLIIPALIGAPKGTGFETVLWSLGSIALIPFTIALVYLNLQVANGTQYVLQYGDIQYRIAFMLEVLSLVGLVLFFTAFSTYMYMRMAMQPEPTEPERVAAPPREIQWLADEE